MIPAATMLSAFHATQGWSTYHWRPTLPYHAAEEGCSGAHGASLTVFCERQGAVEVPARGACCTQRSHPVRDSMRARCTAVGRVYRHKFILRSAAAMPNAECSGRGRGMAAGGAPRRRGARAGTTSPDEPLRATPSIVSVGDQRWPRRRATHGLSSGMIAASRRLQTDWTAVSSEPGDL